MTASHILAIDQGTTGTTAMIVDPEARIVARVTREFPQLFPRPAWVEHDPEAIWASVLGAIECVLAESGLPGNLIGGIGITNQRETVLVWDRATSRPRHNAIVWQDRRTAAHCAKMRADGLTPLFRQRTGLVLDPYFSGTKLAWLLNNVDGLRRDAIRGDVAAGTIDTFLVCRLSGGEAFVTDTTNASRTLLFNSESLSWDPDLLRELDVPAELLPSVRSSSEIYGTTRGVPGLPNGIPIAGIAGDQQAALFGQACFDEGDAKCTYGTGAFLLVNTGASRIISERGVLTTIAWTLGQQTVYALEGSAFIAGAAVQWLRDGLGIITSAAEIEPLARSVEDSGGVTFVPALTGLGAPHWRPNARGLFCGITRGSTKAPSRPRCARRHRAFDPRSFSGDGRGARPTAAAVQRRRWCCGQQPPDATTIGSHRSGVGAPRGDRDHCPRRGLPRWTRGRPMARHRRHPSRVAGRRTLHPGYTARGRRSRCVADPLGGRDFQGLNRPLNGKRPPSPSVPKLSRPAHAATCQADASDVSGLPLFQVHFATSGRGPLLKSCHRSVTATESRRLKNAKTLRTSGTRFASRSHVRRENNPRGYRWVKELRRSSMTSALIRTDSYLNLPALSLLERVLDADDHAWGELLRRYRSLIYRCIGKTLAKFERNLASEDVDEVFGDVCFNLLRNDMRKLRAYDPSRGSKLGSWLGLISINAAYDHLRVTARQPLLDRIEGCPERADAAAGPLDVLLHKERRRRLHTLARDFSARDRTFMELYYSRGMAPAEVARQMNISVKTVYSKKNKIRKRLIAIAAENEPRAMAA